MPTTTPPSGVEPTAESILQVQEQRHVLNEAHFLQIQPRGSLVVLEKNDLFACQIKILSVWGFFLILFLSLNLILVK